MPLSAVNAITGTTFFKIENKAFALKIFFVEHIQKDEEAKKNVRRHRAVPLNIYQLSIVYLLFSSLHVCKNNKASELCHLS